MGRKAEVFESWYVAYADLPKPTSNEYHSQFLPSRAFAARSRTQSSVVIPAKVCAVPLGPTPPHRPWAVDVIRLEVTGDGAVESTLAATVTAEANRPRNWSGSGQIAGCRYNYSTVPV
ncbi:creatininase [Anopheles sinensis]|uniref:Creatininase n=1 Tax=Anopheles sinensis TaxID=74873 RepID=A0A084VLG8_ANOSI|nr:creatininase [Anopheles sinensis]